MWLFCGITSRFPSEVLQAKGFGRTVKPSNVSVTGIRSSGLLFSYVINAPDSLVLYYSLLIQEQPKTDLGNATEHSKCGT